jgi:hypothetical protein
MSEDRTIAGFSPEVWAKFRRPIDKALVSKDPKGLDYVKHQVCIEMLNECFGPDGWWQEIVQTWMQPEYQFKGGQNTGRAYAEAQVKLYIGAPGAEPVCRENIGSQVAAADWSETRKGAVSEALKRAASLFGWAANVYKTEAFASHENGNAAKQQPPAPPPAQKYSLAPAAESKLATLMDALEMPDDVRRDAWATVTSREAAVALKADLEKQLKDREAA